MILSLLTPDLVIDVVYDSADGNERLFITQVTWL